MDKKEKEARRLLAENSAYTPEEIDKIIKYIFPDKKDKPK